MFLLYRNHFQEISLLNNCRILFNLRLLFPQTLMNAITQKLVLQTLFAKTWKAATTVNVIWDIKRMLKTKISARVCKV